MFHVTLGSMHGFVARVMVGFAPFAACFALLGCASTAGSSGGAALAQSTLPCDVAARERARAAGLLAEGRLDRCIRVIRRADAMCPQSAPDTWETLMMALAEVGRADEARSVAAQIEKAAQASSESRGAAKRIVDKMSAPSSTSPDTKRAAEDAFAKATIARGNKRHGEAKKGFLEAWSLSKPNGRALYWAGMSAKELGDKAEAQKLFDRAMVELEITTGKPVIVEAPVYLGGSYWRGDAAAWSRDGRWFASAIGKVMTIRDRFLDFTEVLTFEPHEHEIRRLAISPDGSMVASVAADNALKVTRLHPRIEDIPGQWPEAHDVPLAFSSDGKMLDVGGRFFDLATGEPKGGNVPEAHPNVTFSPDGKTYASGAGDGGVYLSDSATGKHLHTFEGFNWFSLTSRDRTDHSNAKAVAFSPDGRMIVAGSDMESIFIWDVATGATKAELRHHGLDERASRNSLMFSPDGKKLVSHALGPRPVRLFDLETGAVVATEGGGEGAFWFSPDGKTLSLGRINGAVTEWDTSTGARISEELRPACNDMQIAVSPNGKTIAFGCPGDSLRLWNVEDGKTRIHPSGPRGRYTNDMSIAYSSDGHLFQLTKKNDVLHLLDVETGQKRTMNMAYQGRSITFSPETDTFATGIGDVIRLWRFDGRMRNLVGHEGPVGEVAFSPDGKTIASTSADNTVRLWDVATGAEKRKLEGHTNTVSFLRFSPKGDVFVSHSWDGSTRLWDVATGAQKELFQGCSRPVFSPDGTTLALACHPELRLWDVQKGSELRRLTNFKDSVMAFSADGEMLITFSSGNGLVHFWSSAGKALFALGFVAEHDVSILLSADDTPYVEIVGPDEDAARKRLRCRAGDSSYGFDLCRERFEAPGLLSKLRTGDRSYADP